MSVVTQIIAEGSHGHGGDGTLDVALRARVSADIDTDMARIELYFRGQGYRHANRSHLVRIALQNFIDHAFEEIPELRDQPVQKKRERASV